MYHPALPGLHRSSQPQTEDEHYFPVLCYLCWCSPTHSRVPSLQVGCTTPVAETVKIRSLKAWLFNFWLELKYIYMLMPFTHFPPTNQVVGIPNLQLASWEARQFVSLAFSPPSPAPSSSCHPASQGGAFYFQNNSSKGNKIQEIMQHATSQDDLFLLHPTEKLQLFPHKRKLICCLIPT